VLRIFDLYVSRRTLFLIMLETLTVTAAVVCGLRLRFWRNTAEFSYYLGLREFMLHAVAFTAVFQICFYFFDLYDLHAFRRRLEEFVAIGESMGVASLVLALVYFMFPGLVMGRGTFFISLALVPVFLIAGRRTLDRVWRHAGPVDNLLILGDGNLALAVASELRSRNDLHARLAGLFRVASQNRRADGDTTTGLGKELREVVEKERISRIIIAVEDGRNVLPIQDLVRLRVDGVRIEDAQTTIAALTGRVWLQTVKPSWFVFGDGFRRSPVSMVVKRTTDIVVGVVGLLVSLPIMAVIAVAVRLGSKGPALYRQTRVGFRGKCFELLKFRSMRTDAETNGAQWAVEDDPRVTRVGRVLRKYRLDELPQWINIIRGEMSLVGPRPERPEFVDELRHRISYYDERHSVRPGLTGWAQVQYRYGSTVEDAVRKMEYDLFYLKNLSALFDIVILLKTVHIVLAGEGSK